MIIEPIDYSQKTGELITVEETIVGEPRSTIRIWHPFLETGMRMNSCTMAIPQSSEPILLILLPVNEEEMLASHAERVMAGGNVVANAPSEEFFELISYCEMLGADVDAIIERARTLGRTP